MLVYQYLGATVAGNTVLLQGDGLEGEKRFILWLWDCLRCFCLGKIREKQENRNRIGRNQISRRGEVQQMAGGAFNLEGACCFMYCLDVVCLYTDLKNES